MFRDIYTSVKLSPQIRWVYPSPPKVSLVPLKFLHPPLHHSIPPNPVPRQPLIYFLSISQILEFSAAFRILCKWNPTVCLLSCLTSLTFTHVACIKTSLIFIDVRYFIVWYTHNFFIDSLVDGHLGCVVVLKYVQKFFDTAIFKT